MVESTLVYAALRSSMRKSMLDVAYWLNTGTLPINEIHSDSGCSLEDEDHELELGKGEEKEGGSLLVPKQVQILSGNPGTSVPKQHAELSGKNECKYHNVINTPQTSSEDTAAYILANNHITKKTDTMMIVEGSKIVSHFEHHILKPSIYVMNNHAGKTHADSDHLNSAFKKVVPERRSLNHEGALAKSEHVSQNKTQPPLGDSNNLSPCPENGSDESIFKSRFLNENSPLCRNSSQLRKKKLFLSSGSPIEFSPASEVESQPMKVIQTLKNIVHPALGTLSVCSKTPLSLRRSSLPWKRKCAAGNTRAFSNLTRRMNSGNLSKIHEYGESDNILKVPETSPTRKEQAAETDGISSLDSKTKNIHSQIQSSGDKDSARQDLKLEPTMDPSKPENNCTRQKSKNIYSIKNNNKGPSVDEREFRSESNYVITSSNKKPHSVKNCNYLIAKKKPERTSTVSHLDVSGELDITFDEPLQDSNFGDSESRPKKRNHSKFILITSSDESEVLKPVKKKNLRKSIQHENPRRESKCDKMNPTIKNSSHSRIFVQSSKLIPASASSSSNKSDPPVASHNQDLSNHPVKQTSSRGSMCNDEAEPSGTNLKHIYKKPVQLNDIKSRKCHGKLSDIKRSKTYSNSSSDEDIFTPSLKRTQEKDQERTSEPFKRESKDSSMISLKIETVGPSIEEEKESRNEQISLGLAIPSYKEEISDEEDIFTPSFRICLKTGE